MRPTQMRPVAVSIRPQVRVPVSHIASFLNVTADKHQNKETVDKSENREKFKFWTDLKALDRSRQRSCRARCARVRCAIVQRLFATALCAGRGGSGLPVQCVVCCCLMMFLLLHLFIDS